MSPGRCSRRAISTRLLPSLERVPVFVDVADLERLPVGLPQRRNLLVDRTCASSTPGAEGLHNRLGECVPLSFHSIRIELPVDKRVALHPLSGDIEGQAIAHRIGQDCAGAAQRVPNADLVPDIGVVEGQVSDDELGQKQVLEHVSMDRAPSAVGIGAVRHEARSADRGRQQILEYGVTIDLDAVRALLLAERHDDERATDRHGRSPTFRSSKQTAPCSWLEHNYCRRPPKSLIRTCFFA